MDLSHLTLKEHLKGSILTDPFDYFCYFELGET